MARMGFLDKAEELDVMIEAERAVLKKVEETVDQLSLQTYRCCVSLSSGLGEASSPIHPKRSVSEAHLCDGWSVRSIQRGLLNLIKYSCCCCLLPKGNVKHDKLSSNLQFVCTRGFG